jgi:outer membrane biosynthesis protein TonB
MPKNDEGEFELILGNRQLLSVFFIVVVLLGVFFTMGYIVGRNSSTAAPAETARKTDAKPLIVERASPSTSAPAEPRASEPAATTPAAKAEPEAAKPAPEPEHKTEPKAAKKTEPKAEPEPKRKPEPEQEASPGSPAAGHSYLQLAATTKTEAQLYVDVLAKKGFHGIYVPVPEKSSFRVLVGPYRDPAAVSSAREALSKAGFNGYEAILRKF